MPHLVAPIELYRIRRTGTVSMWPRGAFPAQGQPMPEPPDLEVLGLSASERIVIEHALHNSNTCLCGLDNLSAVGCVRKDNSHERRCRQRRLDGSLWCYCCRADRRRIGAYMHPPDASNWYGPCGCPYPDCCDSTGWVCYGRLGRYPTLFPTRRATSSGLSGAARTQPAARVLPAHAHVLVDAGARCPAGR